MDGWGLPSWQFFHSFCLTISQASLVHVNQDSGTRLLSQSICPDMEKVLSDIPDCLQWDGEWEEGYSSGGQVLSTQRCSLQ